VDDARPEAPCAQALDEVVERVLELREDEEALLGPVEEALFAEDRLEAAELRLGAGGLDALRLDGEPRELADLLAYLRRVARERDRFEEGLDALALLRPSRSSTSPLRAFPTRRRSSASNV
jgi:hypothetical protein